VKENQDQVQMRIVVDLKEKLTFLLFSKVAREEQKHVLSTVSYICIF